VLELLGKSRTLSRLTAATANRRNH